MSDMTIKNILSTPFGKTENVRSISSDPISDFKNLLGQSVDDLNRQMAEANQSVQEMLMGKKAAEGAGNWTGMFRLRSRRSCFW